MTRTSPATRTRGKQPAPAKPPRVHGQSCDCVACLGSHRPGWRYDPTLADRVMGSAAHQHLQLVAATADLLERMVAAYAGTHDRGCRCGACRAGTWGGMGHAMTDWLPPLRQLSSLPAGETFGDLDDDVTGRPLADALRALAGHADELRRREEAEGIAVRSDTRA